MSKVRNAANHEIMDSIRGAARGNSEMITYPVQPCVAKAPRWEPEWERSPYTKAEYNVEEVGWDSEFGSRRDDEKKGGIRLTRQ